ncbi:MAG: aminopeptidase P family N-terminal domain-containing protein, partial [Thermodesulfobacteriaceae bacterium]
MNKEELARRIKTLKELISKEPSSSFLILNPINLFYFTGAFFRGALLITNEGLKAFIKRPANVLLDLPGAQVIQLKSLKDLLSHLTKGKVYVDLNCLSFSEAQRLLRVLSGYEVL